MILELGKRNLISTPRAVTASIALLCGWAEVVLNTFTWKTRRDVCYECLEAISYLPTVRLLLTLDADDEYDKGKKKKKLNNRANNVVVMQPASS